jgi:hypothetical protein
VNCASTYGASTAAQPPRHNRWDPMLPCRASNHGTKQFEMPFPIKFKASLSKLRVRFLEQRMNHDVGHGAPTVESNPRLHGIALVTLSMLIPGPFLPATQVWYPPRHRWCVSNRGIGSTGSTDNHPVPTKASPRGHRLHRIRVEDPKMIQACSL